MIAVAEQVEERVPFPPTAAAEPIDREHLTRITMGDRSLEREILALFVRQAGLLLSRMEGLAPSPKTAAAAHTLKGSALGIGAWGVARSAEAVERGEAAEFAAAVRAAEAAVAEARAVIAGLLQAR